MNAEVTRASCDPGDRRAGGVTADLADVGGGARTRRSGVEVELTAGRGDVVEVAEAVVARVQQTDAKAAGRCGVRQTAGPLADVAVAVLIDGVADLDVAAGVVGAEHAVDA